jgi:hypothetical protein
LLQEAPKLNFARYATGAAYERRASHSFRVSVASQQRAKKVMFDVANNLHMALLMSTQETVTVISNLSFFLFDFFSYVFEQLINY